MNNHYRIFCSKVITFSFGATPTKTDFSTESFSTDDEAWCLQILSRNSKEKSS